MSEANDDLTTPDGVRSFMEKTTSRNDWRFVLERWWPLTAATTPTSGMMLLSSRVCLGGFKMNGPVGLWDEAA